MVVAKGDVIACRPTKLSGHLIRRAQRFVFRFHEFQSFVANNRKDLRPFFHSHGLLPPSYCYEAVHVGIVTEAPYRGDPDRFAYIDIQPNNGVKERVVDLSHVAPRSTFIVARPQLASDVLDIVCQEAQNMQGTNYQYFTDHARDYARREAFEFVNAVFQSFFSPPNQLKRDELYQGAENALFCTCLVIRAFSEAAGALGCVDYDPFDNTQSAFYWPHTYPLLLPCQVVGNGSFMQVVT